LDILFTQRTQAGPITDCFVMLLSEGHLKRIVVPKIVFSMACQKALRGIRICRISAMRNFVGGLIGVIIGSIVISILMELPQPIYPEPFNIVWFLLAGSSALQTTLFNPITSWIVLFYIFSWCIIGFMIGLFSKPGWNTVRSAIWVGLIHAVLALISLLLINPGFWSSANRNFDLLFQFLASLMVSILALPLAQPTAMIIERLGRQAEPPIPLKIETVCECGAVFKSIPMICSECGRTLIVSSE